MYSNPSKQVDKGLGFDFSDIADLVKGAGTVGLDLYKQNMQRKQQAAMYGAGLNPALMNQGMYPSSSSNTLTTLLMYGALAVGGVFIYKKFIR